MQVEQDTQIAIRLLYGENAYSNYRRVKLFPEYSLKHFKKYKLEGKKVLSKVNNLDEIFDLLCRDAIVTCYSTNRLDKYFLNLLLELHNVDRKKYLEFIFEDYGKNNKTFDYNLYNVVKENLNDETREFFDTLYDYCHKKKLMVSKLVEEQRYPKIVLERYVSNYLNHKYVNVKENSRLTYYELSDKEAIENIEDNDFSFINLSYPIEKLDYKKQKALLQREKLFAEKLSEYGKIQGFVSRNLKEIKNHKVIETRSLLDTQTQNTDCKKDYAYVYTNSQTLV